jgi:hypothetical protein
MGGLPHCRKKRRKESLAALPLRCPFRKLYPRVAMVKSAQHSISDDDAAPFDWPTIWSVLVFRDESASRCNMRYMPSGLAEDVPHPR